MRQYAVEFASDAIKALNKLDRSASILIYKWIGKNLVDCADPRAHGKAMTGNRAGQWRYPVGNYRLLARIDDNRIVIMIVSIGHRSKIYGN